jgi:hypothetical protein
MQDERLPKLALKYQPMGKRSRGRLQKETETPVLGREHTNTRLTRLVNNSSRRRRRDPFPSVFLPQRLSKPPLSSFVTSALKMETTCFSEKLASTYETIGCQNPRQRQHQLLMFVLGNNNLTREYSQWEN